MLEKVKNNGHDIFLPCGRWLNHGEETTVTKTEAKILTLTNPNIEIIKKKKK